MSSQRNQKLHYSSLRISHVSTRPNRKNNNGGFIYKGIMPKISPSRKLTAKVPENMKLGRLHLCIFFFGKVCFQGRLLLVSGRVSIPSSCRKSFGITFKAVCNARVKGEMTAKWISWKIPAWRWVFKEIVVFSSGVHGRTWWATRV